MVESGAGSGSDAQEGGSGGGGEKAGGSVEARRVVEAGPGAGGRGGGGGRGTGTGAGKGAVLGVLSELGATLVLVTLNFRPEPWRKRLRKGIPCTFTKNKSKHVYSDVFSDIASSNGVT